VAHFRLKSISVRRKTLWMRFDSINAMNNLLMPKCMSFFVWVLYAVRLTILKKVEII